MDGIGRLNKRKVLNDPKELNLFAKDDQLNLLVQQNMRTIVRKLALEL